MDKNRMVNQGMTQVLTGLGILLGSGRISNATHEQILALINADDGGLATTENGKLETKEEGYPRAGKETPVSMRSNDLGSELGTLVTADSKTTRRPDRSAPQKGGSSDLLPHRPSSAGGLAAPKLLQPGSSQVKMVCPWWSTEGYHCRERDRGICAWIHEDIADGLRDPLICSFWADGNRCTKSDDDCRFAHYPAQHRQIAPAPNSNNKKKSKKNNNNNNKAKVSSNGGADEW
ncbi:hypothetical protein F4779DRAFT_591366 [Xylariaceae sp. FL0662B]|nr:hypothetical protein F4779DRAFT_591366 [Xylariaceae sp. FL0662B]